MDSSILGDDKHCFYGVDFLDQLSKDYQWDSLLDSADASPSEILADAAPVLLPPISPESLKSSPNESSNSDSGSDDDFKNSSGTSARQSSLSPYDWLSTFDDEVSCNLKLEDVEQFLQKTAPINNNNNEPCINTNQPNFTNGRKGPVMAIENGIIKYVKVESSNCDDADLNNASSPPKQEIVYPNKAYFNVVNENYHGNSIIRDEKKNMTKNQLLVGLGSNDVAKTSSTKKYDLLNGIPTGIVQGPKVSIKPLPQRIIVHHSASQKQMSPTRGNIVPKLPVPAQVPTPPVFQSGTTLETDISLNPDIEITKLGPAEIKALKKQQRMIKNRESACQSRQKKKDYVTTLEQNLVEAHLEINKLRIENKMLKEQLEGTCGRTRKMPRFDTSVLVPKKNIAVIFAMVFMVSLNFNMLGWNSKPLVGPSASHQSIRHLLWSEENSTIDSETEPPANFSSYENGYYSNTTQNNMSVNQTESLRIVGELNRWIGGAKSVNWTNHMARRKRKAYQNEDKINGDFLESYRLFQKLYMDTNLLEYSTLTRLRSLREKSRLRRLRRTKDEFPENLYDYETSYSKLGKSVDDYISDFGEWRDLIQALHRRDDTFYVVGVGKGEHLLLPAVSHNVTKPPKMALILPAAIGNDSISSDHVTLMQIDCSIVNTTLVKLKSDKLPESLRTKNSQAVQNKSVKRRDLRTDKDTVNSSLSGLTHNASNLSHYPTVYPMKPKIKNRYKGVKDDLFAQYLFSKYEESKQNQSIGPVKKIHNMKSPGQRISSNLSSV